MSKRRILILGGGFAGVYVAAYLGRLMKGREREEAEVVLVSRDNYLTFQPLLPEVISGSVELNHVVAPLRRLAPAAHLQTREVESIDLVTRSVTLAPAARPETLTLSFDHLVLALGSRLDDSQIPGLREHAQPFRDLGDALRLRHQMVQALEQAETERDPETKRQLLTFVVAGGGFSGTECIAEMNDFLREAVRSFHHIEEPELRLVLLQRGERILPEVTPSLADFAHRLLEARGVEILTGTHLTAVSATAVEVQDRARSESRTIPARTVVATVPAGPHALVQTLPLAQERGRIRVDETLAAPGWDGVWALGDCAAVPQRDGQLSPPTAQHALRQARTCAENILATMRRQPCRRFLFTGLGKLGSLGRRSAVAEVFGLRLKGLPAWLLWRGVYATKFPGLGGQVRLLADWLLDALLPRDIHQLRLFRPADVRREHFFAGQCVFRTGDVGDKVYFVVRGSAAVLQDGETIAQIESGGVFGEGALLSDGSRNATVRAQTALEVVTVSRSAFTELLAHVPGVHAAMETIAAPRATAPVEKISSPAV